MVDGDAALLPLRLLRLHLRLLLPTEGLVIGLALVVLLLVVDVVVVVVVVVVCELRSLLKLLKL